MGHHKSTTTKPTARKHGMDPDSNFGAPNNWRNTGTFHTTYKGHDGLQHCTCCVGAHKARENEDRRTRANPDLSGRKMARGDEWRYSERPSRPFDDEAVRSNMVSRESPEFMTRISVAVPKGDFGHSHAFAEGQHTSRLRDASVNKGCGKKTGWLRNAMSEDSPFPDPCLGPPEPRSSYARPYAGSGPNGTRQRPKSAPGYDVTPPYASSILQHTNEFNKPSTNKRGLGKARVNQFYNATGGWSAAR